MGEANIIDSLDLPVLAAAPAPLALHSRLYARNSGGNDVSTVLLAHMDGGEGSAAFVDDSASGHVITAVGGVTQSAGIAKFGPSVLKLDGGPAGAGEHISVADSDDFFFDADFTVDGWIHPFSGATAAIWGQNTDDDNRILIFRGGTSISVFVVIGGVVGPFFTTPALFSLIGLWTHVAVERMGTSWYTYINGVPRAFEVNAAVLPNFTSAFTIGQALIVPDLAPFIGFMDEFRVSKGIARYGGAAFAVPDVPYDVVAPYALNPDGFESSLIGQGRV